MKWKSFNSTQKFQIFPDLNSNPAWTKMIGKNILLKSRAEKNCS